MSIKIDLYYHLLLVKMLLIRQFIDQVSHEIPGFVRAYVFGSYAKDRQNIDSDIDIAIIINEMNDADRFDMQVKLLLLASGFDPRIEPHPISSDDLGQGNPFVHEIVRTGIEVKL
jgi:uncharacterized protein